MSDMVPLYGFGGGGGAALNFAIVGGTSQPENPKENTIWVNTDAEIAGWVIAPSQPDNPAEGMVFVKTDTRSAIVCNVLKKNTILITPLSARQYVSGAWADKDAMIYQDGAWQDFIDWSKWIIKDGLTKYTMSAKGAVPNSSWSGTASMTITQERSDVKVYASDGFGMFYIGTKIDLTNVSSITIEGTFSITANSNYAAHCTLSVWSAIGTYINDYKVASKALTSAGATLDVSSLTGEYYIGFSIRGASTQYVTNLYMDA